MSQNTDWNRLRSTKKTLVIKIKNSSKQHEIEKATLKKLLSGLEPSLSDNYSFRVFKLLSNYVGDNRSILFSLGVLIGRMLDSIIDLEERIKKIEKRMKLDDIIPK